GQWSVEKINDWYKKQPWIVGCNFLPSTAVNDVEMWQDETFDLATIDKELGYAKDWGINSVRVFLNYVVWEAEAEKLKANFKKFLDVAEKHGISVMPVFFDECNWSNGVAHAGKQPEPIPGIHNSGWVPSPSLAMLRNQAEWTKLKNYMQDIIGSFASDKRIIIWDIFNEPEWRGANERVNIPQTASLIRNMFAWAREMKPTQPLTIGAHDNFNGELSKLMRSGSDIVSFHSYGNKADAERKIKWSHETGRPALCTEWLIRSRGNTPEIFLPLFKETKTGGYLWGLVGGRTQTYYPWGSRKGAPEPKIWQHDLIRQDGTPHIPAELETFRKYSSSATTTTTTADDKTVKLLDGQWSIDAANNWYEKNTWIVGCNFLPSTAVNDVEMWQDETFDLATIDKELGLAKGWGINSVRVFLNYVVWEAEEDKLKSNFTKFLDVAEKHGISVMPVLFDDCNFSDGLVAKIGKQPEPVENYYANAWVASPPAAMVRDESQWQKLKNYEQDMIRTFSSDKRIIIWDLYNEPGNSGSKLKKELLENVFAWARELKPTQPLTMGAYTNWEGDLSKLTRSDSDIVSFHSYGNKADFESKIQWAKIAGRPVVCTEWLNRPENNSVEEILPVLKETKTGGYLWGLVNGKTQTHLQWGSTPQNPRNKNKWQHDLMHNNGSVYNPSELHLFRSLAGNFVTKNDDVLLPNVDLQLKDGQWSIEKVTEWYNKQKWIVGCNFLPSTAINDVEMWQDETFDLPTIDKELGFAKALGINSVRVFLNYVVWEAEAEKFKSNFKKFLDVAEKHGISVMPILFDDCNFSGNIAKVGKQQDPVPGVHNSGWVSSPPATMVRNESQWQKLKDYEQDMIRTFGSDKRIIIWDLYNEPGNSGSGLKKELLENIFVWAREIKPNQPLTIGAFHNWESDLSKLMRNGSDVVSFHSYGDKKDVENKIQWAHSTGRPAVCTEWLRRQGGNTVQNILPLFKSNNIGGYNWGLVAGRTQTYIHWVSKKGTPTPAIWQHDLIREDGTPYDIRELVLIRK
ncbi:MAG: cellulase family glycosylhydrolase, partial [Planctomycetaceae bacterium]|nr:cellulase family glycosylhydrolase [Planctomycetaceae bacterium]